MVAAARDLRLLTPEGVREAWAAAGLPTGNLGRAGHMEGLLAHRPEPGYALTRVVRELMDRPLLPRRLRELIILRIAWTTGAEYEWAKHWRIALEVGVPSADAAAVRTWKETDCFDARERAALAATDDVVGSGAVDRATFSHCREFYDDAEILELVFIILTWRLFASLICSFELPLEDGEATWPPDGSSPPSIP